MIILKVISDQGQSRIFRIDKNLISLGRSSAADIVIDDKKASRNHARIIAAGGVYKIEDLGSRNGIFVNGKKISQKQKVGIGDSIKIGNTQITISSDSLKKETEKNNKPLLIAVLLIILLVPSVAIPVYLFTGNTGIDTSGIYIIEDEEPPPEKDYSEVEEGSSIGTDYNEQELIEDTLGDLQKGIEETREINFSSFDSAQDFLNIENYRDALNTLIYNWGDIVNSVEGLPDFPGKADILYSATSVYDSLNEINMFLDDYDLIHIKDAVIGLYNALDNLDGLLTEFL